jgi:hypothetical protein
MDFSSASILFIGGSVLFFLCVLCALRGKFLDLADGPRQVD